MKEAEIAGILRGESEEFKNLESEHKKLDLSLEEIKKKKHLSTDEEITKKKIQKQKLQLKDRMAQLIRGYKK
jgi:uncharacterized protein YdcH (DUF465 family)